MAALLACLAPLFLAFAWQGGLASIGDDSASYVAMAQAIAGANPAILPWVGYHTHFPPLFPLVLALSGAARNLAIGHAVVALLAVGALALAYRFVLRETGRRSAAFLLVVAFVLCPTAWISAKGILSEPMYLFASLWALVYFQQRLEDGSGDWRPWLAFGFLLAGAFFTRVVGATIVAALVAWFAVRALERRWPPRAALLAFVPIGVLLPLWLWLRPVAYQDSYQRVATNMSTSWNQATGLMASVSGNSVLAGWVASFTADANVGMAALVAVGLVAVLAAAGLWLRLVANRLDAWYVAISLGVVVWWVFSEDNTRRLLYPLLPLLLFYAGGAIVAACRRLGRGLWAPYALGAAGAVMALACVPAIALVAEKALDRAPVLAAATQRYSDMTEYYTTINVQRSRALAGKHAVVLAGLESLRRVTPPEARVMWMRPEYIALLGRREGVAWYYGWDAKRVAREVRDARVDYLIVAYLFKTDLRGNGGDPFATYKEVADYADPLVTLANPATGGTDFVLLRVDRAKLDAWLAAHP
jgi:4-amino-4-deoxy-L-arabinose transferase-like glycosyltransferase